MSHQPDACPPLQTWRVWPAHGISFTVQAHCLHQHLPGGDWSLNRAGGEIVALMQACGTVVINETVMQKDPC